MTTYTLEYELEPHTFEPADGPVCGRCSLLPENHDEELATRREAAQRDGVI